MKLTVLLLTTTILQLSASSYGQNVTLHEQNVSLVDVFKEIRKQTGYDFFYNDRVLENTKNININLKEAPLTEALDACFTGQPITYSINNKIVIVKALERPSVVEIKSNPAEINAKGKVVDANGLPLPGVSITVKGASKGTQTDVNGAFTLSVSKGSVLVFSFIGYKKKEITVEREMVFNVILEEDLAKLEQVVVVGYGETRKKDLTGSIASIKAEAVQSMNSPNFDVALVGQAPGVYVVKTNGAPGADASIRIRGGTSVLGVNEPLYVIDGIPVQIGGGGGSDSYSNSRSVQISPLASINPEDLESIDILKDASATAIYGSRAANGVVIITTKRGKKGQEPSLKFSYSSVFEDFTNRYKMLNTAQYIDVVNKAYANANLAVPADFKPNDKVYSNWQNEVTQVSQSNSWNLSLTGGTPNSKTIYAFSAGTNDQKGVIMGSGFKRYNLATNLETNVFDKLKVGTNLKYSQSTTKGNGNSFYYNIVKYRPDVPIYDEKGNYATTIDSTSSNPYAQLKQISESANKNLMASFYGEFEIVNGLKLKSSLSYNTVDGTNLRYIPSWDAFEARNRRTGSRTDNLSSFDSRIFDNTLTYNNFFGKHYVNALAGASFTQDKSNYTRVSSSNFPNDDALNNLGSAATISQYGSGGSISGLESYFIRGNYNYAGKYYLTFTGRADKSTKFGPNNQWGVFPSAALAWRISEENFLKKYDFINDAKLRISAGRTGSANFGDFLYSTFFTTGSFYNGVNGVIPNTVPNPSIRWETTNQLDAGLDFSLFQNKLRGSVTYYYKLTKDLILGVDVPYETGAANQLTNIGDVLNKGLEIQLGTDIISTNNFTWSTDFNISFNNNVLKKLNGGSLPNGVRLTEGEPLSYFYGYKTDGLFQTQSEIDALNAAAPNNIYQAVKTAPGDYKFVDTNKDGYITADDMVKLGNAEPDFFGGWNHTLRYKKFSLSALFNYSVGNVLYNSSQASLSIFNSYLSNYNTGILNAWTPEHPNTNSPRVVAGNPNQNGRISDQYVSTASFIRLKNLYLSYLLNDTRLNKFYLNNVRLFVAATNVFTVTGYNGLDPEVNTNPSSPIGQGYDGGGYPQTRSFSMGVNVTF
ncbi:TonB-dependent receptor [Solitalea sp. MAHUQ-68]|uniref:TonB-dependent receptor n=1 Tax=Solitalea agri TaxID=2953739 RepID=A0A9X2F4U2_9SPHI|nr:TonB-dependent receptor [Solitalea agri]MCO4294214.1 TonB-dependent receptor [Solitalea agri]